MSFRVVTTPEAEEQIRAVDSWWRENQTDAIVVVTPHAIHTMPMQSQHIPMSFDAFELLPWKPEWKYEYWDGVAHITPRHQTVTVRVRIENTLPTSMPGGRPRDGRLCIRPCSADEKLEFLPRGRTSSPG